MKDKERLLECAKEFNEALNKAIEHQQKHIDELDKAIDQLERVLQLITNEIPERNGNN